jgi:hypothetical protein
VYINTIVLFCQCYGVEQNLFFEIVAITTEKSTIAKPFKHSLSKPELVTIIKTNPESSENDVRTPI